MSIWRPRWVRSSWNFAEIFGVSKLDSMGCRIRVVLVILDSSILVELRLVTNRRTDTQLHHIPIYHSVKSISIWRSDEQECRPTIMASFVTRHGLPRTWVVVWNDNSRL